VSLLE
jgi:hypothetical protein